MNKILFATTIAILAIGAGTAFGMHEGVTVFENGVTTVECHGLCFDLEKNSETDGYDPRFLTHHAVIANCFHALADGVKLNYCDTSYGNVGTFP